MSRGASKGDSNGSLSRKVQKLGASSLIVTLPRSWTKRHNVNVGDLVTIYDEGDRLVIAPSGEQPKDRLYASLSKSSCMKHVGRLVLCSYIFGYDVVIGESNRIIKGEPLDRIARTSSYLHGAEIRLSNNNKMLEIIFTGREDNVEELIQIFGKRISQIFGTMSRYLKGEAGDLDDIANEYTSIMRMNYRILRSLNKMKPMDRKSEKRVKQLYSAVSTLGMAADAAISLASLLQKMSSELDSDERDRLAFLLELAEIATATIVASLNPASVKKAEDAYWKIRNILDLEENSHELIAGVTPQYAYILSRIIEIARLLEVAENILLCIALSEKHIRHG